MITDFVTYSPTIDPSELKNFIYSKFRIKCPEAYKNWAFQNSFKLRLMD